MRKLATSLVARLLPSLTDFVFLTPVVFLFGRMGGTRALLGDADTGWHIRTGEWILAHHQVPMRDLFSFTQPDRPWYAWEWLSDVLMALLHGMGGLRTVVLVSILMICLTVALLFRLVLKQSGNVAIAYIVTVLAAAGSSLHWLARPHLVSLLFIVLFLTALQTWHLRRLWFLPPLMVLWTNLHGGFFIGIVLTGGWAVGEWLSAALSSSRARSAHLRLGYYYAAVAGACLGASFLNPYTWRLHAHLVEYLTHPGYFEGIQEFQPLSLSHPLAHFYESMLFMALAAACWCLRRRDYPNLIQILLWSHLSLLAARNIPVFCFVVAAPVARAVADWCRVVHRASSSRWLRGLADAASRTSAILAQTGLRPGWGLILPLTFWLIGSRIYVAGPAPLFDCTYDPAVYPAAAMTRLAPEDRVFTDDEWGDYLIYHSRPLRRVFVDGRSDFYGPEFEKRYLDILNLRTGWKKTLADFSVDTILARKDTPLAAVLTEMSEWSLTYEDSTALIFHRSQP